MIDITPLVQEQVRASGVRNGVCHLFVLHTTAGITINEGADPAVQRDMISFLNRLVPHDPYFTHAEGNSDAHIKSTLVGTSLEVFICEGKPLLGTWQSIYFCEFDGPRHRKVALKISSDS
jgi:secondary thiamine-phosphate synthase enzyme